MNWFDFYARVYDPFMKLFRVYDPKILDCLDKPGDRVLDLGGGTGYYAEMLSERAGEVVVVDSSHKMLNQVKRKKNIKTCHAKAQKIPYPDKYFDSVICIDALHHIKEHDLAIAEIRRVLKDNGKLLIEEVEIKGLFGSLIWLFEKVYIDDSKFISPRDLLSKMKENNFSGKIINHGMQYLYIGKKDE